MAIFLDSTPAPAVQPGLLRTWAGALSVPTPALTAETVAMLDATPADVPHRGAGMTRHHGAPMCSAADLPCGDITTPALTVGVCCAVQQTAVADLPRGAASGVLSTVETTPADSRGDIGTTDLASALHMRRALEGALDHGTALLAALGLPSLVEPGFVPLDPAAIGDALDTAIATLDALDAPGADLEDEGEAEPSLGWIDGKPVLSDSHDDREAEDDDEPILGAPERHPQSGPWGPQRDISGSQTDWADGSARHDEAEAVNEDGGDILDEGEETLGWAANVSQLALGQTTADGDATALERHGRGFLRSGPDDAEDGGDAERDDEHGSEDGEDIGHFARDWRSVIRDIQREREAAHV